MKPRNIAVALAFVSIVHLGATVREAQAPSTPGLWTETRMAAIATPSPAANRALGRLPTAAPDALMPAYAAPTPYAAIEAASLPREVASLPRAIATLPSRNSQAAPTATLVSSRTPVRAGCDPAYPDERTCIPPGPPFNLGCAITAERRFIVLAPDPQKLDHDKDGIGCEPMR